MINLTKQIAGTTYTAFSTSMHDVHYVLNYEITQHV